MPHNTINSIFIWWNSVLSLMEPDMAKARRKSHARPRRSARPKPESWPNFHFGDNGGKKLPLLVRLLIAVLVLAAIAFAVRLWYTSRACYHSSANPEGQPQARQVLPPPVQPVRPANQVPPAFRLPVRAANTAAVPAKANAKPAHLDLIVFHKNKKDPMVLIYPRSASVGVQASIVDSQNKVLKTLDQPAGKPGRVWLKWDGKDAQGKAVPDGKYLVKVKSAQGEDTKELKIIP
jgi:hypothetical protein